MSAGVLPTELHVEPPRSLDGRTCPRCGFDSVLDFPVFVMSALGVVELDPVAGCVRCLVLLAAADTPDR